MSYRRPSRKKERPCLSMDNLLALVAEHKNGQPNYGAILKYFRLHTGWKGWELALLYSEALDAEGLEEETKLVTQNWIYMMENQNMVPLDEKRRWMLATLLDIPPVLFGLESTSPHDALFLWKPVDVMEYRAALVQYCASFHLSGLQLHSLRDVKRRISALHREAPFANPLDKQGMFTLLCGYYILAGDIVRDQMGLGEGIALHSRAITIAEENMLYDLWAYALRQRGNTYADRGQITAGLKGFAAAQADFAAAARDMQAAQHLESHLSPHRQASIALSAGVNEAWMVRDRQELLKALKVIDQVTGQIDKPADEQSIVALRLDQGRYHLSRALALLASPFQTVRAPASARQALEEVTRATAQTQKGRQADNALLLAKSYLVEGFYAMATARAEDALELVKDIGSRWRLAYIENLYRDLRVSSYGKEAEVAKLGVKLVRVQQPELFNG